MTMENLSARIGKGVSFTRSVHDDERANAIRALGREDEIQARAAEQLADRMKPGGVVYFLGVFLVGIRTGLHTQQPMLFIVFAVLLVDHKTLDASAFIRLLTKLGCQADWVGTGRDVIRRLECEHGWVSQQANKTGRPTYRCPAMGKA